MGALIERRNWHYTYHGAKPGYGRKSAAQRIIGDKDDPDAWEVVIIVGVLPPGTGGIVWTGERGQSGDGGLWYRIIHPRIPAGGWVDTRFLTEEASAAPDVSAEPPGSLFKDHTAHQHRYRVVGVASNDVLICHVLAG